MSQDCEIWACFYVKFMFGREVSATFLFYNIIIQIITAMRLRKKSRLMADDILRPKYGHTAALRKRK